MAPEKLALLEEQVNVRVADPFRLTPEERRLIAAGSSTMATGGNGPWIVPRR